MKRKSTIKNYTSTVPAERSIARIEELIAEFGATDVSKQYDLKQRSVLQSFLSDTVDARTGKPVHQIIAATRRLLPSPASDPDIVEAG